MYEQDNTDDNLVGRTGTVTGWGRRTEFGNISPVLREVHLPIISNSKVRRISISSPCSPNKGDVTYVTIS